MTSKCYIIGTSLTIYLQSLMVLERWGRFFLSLIVLGALIHGSTKYDFSLFFSHFCVTWGPFTIEGPLKQNDMQSEFVCPPPPNRPQIKILKKTKNLYSPTHPSLKPWSMYGVEDPGYLLWIYYAQIACTLYLADKNHQCTSIVS